MKTDQQSDKAAIRCERLLYAIVTTLVFEGLIRKVVPSALGLVIFFIKDFLCLYALYLVTTVRLPGLATWLNTRWKIVAVLFIPLLIYTAFLDLPLSVFAAKQYLLYAGVSLLVPLAFPENRVEQFKRFALLFALLLIPTTTVAILQNSLPPSHWLNLSVGGESLQGFAAAGFLRVSSTFSFTGQYGWFLNAVCAFIISGFFLPSHHSKRSFFWRTAMPLASGILLTIGVFITGGRTAVFGNAGCILVGFALSVWKSPVTSVRKGLLVGLFLIPSFWLLHELKPEFFAAYDARSAGTEDVSNQEEMQDRILGGYTDWTNWYGEQELTSILIGNGLGIMSNGSDKISNYASTIRSTGFWMEGDVSATVWEGGIYLMLLWYGFRFAVIVFCLRLWQSMKNPDYSLVSSFMLANVIINGVMGNMAMQPPIAIWWWLSVGSIIAVYGFDREFVKKDSASDGRRSPNNHLRHTLSIHTAVA
jgi:hypothetical protein